MVTRSGALPERAIRWCGSAQGPVDDEVASIDVPVLVEVPPPAPVVELALLLLLLALLLAELALVASLELLPVLLVPPAPPVPCGQMAASGSVSQRDCHFVS